LNLTDWEQSITNWAHARNLINGTTVDKQFVKLIEEAGEVAECLAKDQAHQLESEIGDMLVVLNNIAVNKGLTLTDCANVAWMKVKDRRGMMIDGYYVKEEDLPPEGYR
jgi:phosphoribosyl-ATP pyrophosphohydrolase